MIPFLQQVATAFYRRYGEDIQTMAFVFPNRRAGMFFRKHLAQAAGKPLFAPTILTISELFVQLSGKQPADRIRMLFRLYKIYIRLSGWDESFDDFVYWGEMLLNDFDDVDKYLVDARRLFTNVTDLHDLEKDFSYLNEDQISAIRSFWSSFRADGESGNQQYFLKIWQLLYAMYSEFRETLAAEGTGYEGMIFREVVERIAREGVSELPCRKVVFVGLNALSAAEKQLLLLLRKQGIADFYWDYASDMVTDNDNRASYFIKEHLHLFPSELHWPAEKLILPEIELIGVPSRIGQAKQVASLLKEMLGGRPAIGDEEALQTAIVLPDEQLLIPVLNSIPEEITRINVTLGYPLSGAPVAALMELILALRKNSRTADDGSLSFYYRETLAVLNHPYIRSLCPDVAHGLVQDISVNNKIHVAAADMSLTPLLALIFAPVKNADALSDYLIAVLQELNRAVSSLHPDRDDDAPVCMDELEQEFIYHYFTIVNRMRDLIAETGIRMSVETYFSLLKSVTDTLAIPFQGEPLSGLQVMGVLETRVLDFERLIILSMNEGLFPAKRQANTFIPYNLRRGFGLPAFEHQDSIWAYHFYRLITRAKRVTLLYDTRTEGAQTGEASRFVHQLKYHYGVPVKEKRIIYNVSSSRAPVLQVEKTAEVMAKLAACLQGGEKALSASTINTCLDCPLKFYFSSIEGLKEEEEVSESIENSLFGSILHKVLERLYEPFCRAQVTDDLLKLAARESTLTDAIQRAFAELFFHSEDVRPLSGRHYLTGEMIRKYALKVLESDRRLTPFRYVRSERRMQTLFPLTNGRVVRLKGFIDRLDEVGGSVRIVDYKTGIRKPLDFKTIDSLFDPADAKRQPAIMQVFTYAWMYGETDGLAPVRPVVYYMRDLFAGEFDPVICIGKDKTPVSDFTPYRIEFEDALRRCLDNIFHPDIPFAQTADNKTCAFCPFAGICGR
ncbi:MAG: PD-(D/E)XK nuclease family protein [Tannerella sp.]|jgi:hypothetical protein|nr:PD-(D/E)XK nuclease family protein [Tannerella sp.]